MGIIALTAAALFMAERKPKRWLYFAVAVGGSFSCIMSRSRGGLLALFAGLLVLSLFRNRKVFVIIAILGASYRLWLPVSVLQRIDEAYVVDEAGRIEAADTAAQRLTIWRSGMAMIQDRPLGVGLGAFPYFSALYGTILEMRHPDKSAHNEFLRVAAELGVVGFAAFTWLLLRLALSSWRAYRRGSEIGLSGVAFAGLGALIGMSLSSISGTFFFQATISGHFWMVMGLLARSECLSRPEEKPRPEQARWRLA
jgi:O-antigen ligase